ncbi:MAG: methionine--tRNA ligase [Paracoccaceae bacterium]
MRHLITSAIPYINGVKHLGNLVGSMLPADLYARHLRARGHEVLFLCATDEHGTPAELAARKAGLPVAEYCARMHEVQADLGARFGLSFDLYGRSSSPANHALTQHFADALDRRGLIEAASETQMYSATDGRFLPDRYIEGTCPNCGFQDARGDQCDNCTKQLTPSELIAPRSSVSGATDLQPRETRHLHLRQSAMRDRLREWIDGQDDWPVLTTSIARKWLDDGDGLQDRGITRDLDWGVPVARPDGPWEGMEGKVFYVWFDAPIAYIATAQDWAERTGGDWESWWRTDRGAGDVRYTQFMGKDNVPFHTLSFPATILGSGEPWKLVDYIKSFNYLTYDGGQFSTSRGRGVFMDAALEILPADVWRWWLLSRAPETSDTEFTWAAFQMDVNKDLADVLGNFVSRVTKFCRSKFGEAVPEGAPWGEAEAALTARLSDLLAEHQRHMDAIEIRKGAAALRAIWVAGNEYLQDAAPWAAFKTDPERAAMQVALGLNLIRLYAVLSAPFVPTTAARMLSAMDTLDMTWPEPGVDGMRAALTALPAGHGFTVPDVLFAKITDEQREGWAERFSGTRA